MQHQYPFRHHIILEALLPPESALQDLRRALRTLQPAVPPWDPSAVGSSTEPNFRQRLKLFLDRVATYDEGDWIELSQRGEVAFVVEYHVDDLRVWNAAEGQVVDEEEGRTEISQYDRTHFAIRVRELLGYATREEFLHLVSPTS